MTVCFNIKIPLQICSCSIYFVPGKSSLWYLRLWSNLKIYILWQNKSCSLKSIRPWLSHSILSVEREPCFELVLTSVTLPFSTSLTVISIFYIVSSIKRGKQCRLNPMTRSYHFIESVRWLVRLLETSFYHGSSLITSMESPLSFHYLEDYFPKC